MTGNSPTRDLDKKIGGYPIHFKNASEKQKSFILTGLPQGVGISVETFNDFVRVNIRASNKKHFEGAMGLMGAFPSGNLVARDGNTVKENTDAFGQEWQVLANEDKAGLDGRGRSRFWGISVQFRN